MTKELRLIIPGKPIAKKRPRFVRRGKFVGTYNSQETEEGRWLWEAKQQMTGFKMLEEPIEIEMSFFMPRPLSHYGTGKNKGLLKKSAPIFHISKPDIDNLEKMVFDCLNQVVWGDDSMVVRSKSTKAYADSGPPRTEIKIRGFGDYGKRA